LSLEKVVSREGAKNAKQNQLVDNNHASPDWWLSDGAYVFEFLRGFA
jgi:hypothetical protein